MTKTARRTGVGKATSKGDDVSFCDAYSDIDAGDDTDNDAKRHGQPHDHATDDNDNYDIGEARGHKSAVGRRAAKKRPYSPQDSSTDNSADEDARATGADEGPPRRRMPRRPGERRPGELPPKEGRTTPSRTTRPHPRPIGSRTPAKRPTPRPTGAGARQEQTP